MHPGLVQANVRHFGNDFIANVGGAIHGHPMGTLAGAKAMRQAIDTIITVARTVLIGVQVISIFLIMAWEAVYDWILLKIGKLQSKER